jgi:hypothetical protein
MFSRSDDDLPFQVGQKEAEQSFSQLLLPLEEQKLDLVFYYPTEHASLVIKLMKIFYIEHLVDNSFSLPLVVLQKNLMKHIGPNWNKSSVPKWKDLRTTDRTNKDAPFALRNESETTDRHRHPSLLPPPQGPKWPKQGYQGIRK